MEAKIMKRRPRGLFIYMNAEIKTKAGVALERVTVGQEL